MLDLVGKQFFLPGLWKHDPGSDAAAGKLRGCLLESQGGRSAGFAFWGDFSGFKVVLYMVLSTFCLLFEGS